MRSDIARDEKRHEPDYGAQDDGPVYDDEWRDAADDRAYWRRRFFILCGGLIALGVCAWMLPGPHQPSGSEAAAASASKAALASQRALPPAANGPAWHAATVMPDVYPTEPAKSAAGAKATAKATAAAKATKSAKTAGGARQPGAKPGARPAAKPAACKPADIVLSLSTSEASYAKGAHPSFSVYAVSTAAAPCTLTYGAGAVQVVVTRQGHVVWDSTACKPKPASPARFTLGVPQVLGMVWNPAAKRPAGCGGSLPASGTGTLDAVAISHGQSSPVRSFTLSR